MTVLSTSHKFSYGQDGRVYAGDDGIIQNNVQKSLQCMFEHSELPK